MKSENFDPNDPIQMGYTLQGSMKGSADLVGKGYADVHTYMRKFGWERTDENGRKAILQRSTIRSI